MTTALVGIALALAIGIACRWLDIPVPAPPRLQGALLVVAMAPAAWWAWWSCRQWHLGIGPLRLSWRASVGRVYGLAARVAIWLAGMGVLVSAVYALGWMGLLWVGGPGTAVYGADAYSGVINIVTKELSQQSTSAGVRTAPQKMVSANALVDSDKARALSAALI